MQYHNLLLSVTVIRLCLYTFLYCPQPFTLNIYQISFLDSTYRWNYIVLSFSACCISSNSNLWFHSYCHKLQGSIVFHCWIVFHRIWIVCILSSMHRVYFIHSSSSWLTPGLFPIFYYVWTALWWMSEYKTSVWWSVLDMYPSSDVANF